MMMRRTVYPSRVAFLAAALLIISALTGCDKEPATPTLPAFGGEFDQAPAVATPYAFLSTGEFDRSTLELLGQVQSSWTEVGHTIVSMKDGRLIELYQDGESVGHRSLGKLPVTCPPIQVAIDAKGGACVVTACHGGTFCNAGGEFEARDEYNGTVGVASTKGAILRWRRVGSGLTVWNAPSGPEAPESDKPRALVMSETGEGYSGPEMDTGTEVLASSDGGASWGAIGTVALESSIVDVHMTARNEGHWTALTPTNLVTVMNAPGQRPDTSTITGNRRVAQRSGFEQLLLAHGMVASAESRSDGLVVRSVIPGLDQTNARTHFVEAAQPPSAVIAWDKQTVLAVFGTDLVQLDMVEGRWRRVDHPWAEPQVPAKQDGPTGGREVGEPGSPSFIGRIGPWVAGISRAGSVTVLK